MSVFTRRAAERQANAAYRTKFRWSVVCTYCGMPAEAADHVFPISRAVGLDLFRPGVRAQLKQGLNCVPACRECNSLGGDRPFVLISEKRAFIQEKLKRRYYRDLMAQDWTDEELRGMGRMLKAHILKGERARIRASMRLNWPHSRAQKWTIADMDFGDGKVVSLRGGQKAKPAISGHQKPGKGHVA